MTRTIRTRLALFGIASAILFAAAPRAQAQATVEGTVITNNAKVSFTDANNNTYTDVTASVSVTVGYKAGLDVQSTASVTPSSPSTGNELNFTVVNGGNGNDSVSVSFTSGTGVTITGYKIGATTYTTLAELNTALSGTQIARNGSLVVTVVYTVAPGQGGATIPVSMTATSRRDTDNTNTGRTDTSSTNVIPTVASGVNVTPDNSSIDRVPNSATVTTYTETFTVENTGNASDTFTLSASTSNATMVTGITIAGGSTRTIAAGGTATISVTYSIPAATANGTTGTLALTATSQSDASKSDGGSYAIRATKAVLVLAKAAFRDNKTTPIANSASDPVKPGEYFWYRLTVTNNGHAAASSVVVEDQLPTGEVVYNNNDVDAAGWTISTTTVASVVTKVSGTLSGTLAAGASRYFWVRVQVK